jgi:hypothetical protein
VRPPVSPRVRAGPVSLRRRRPTAGNSPAGSLPRHHTHLPDHSPRTGTVTAILHQGLARRAAARRT